MGSVDLFHSRRVNYNRCEYWVRDERNKTSTPSDIVYYNQSSGVFYAKVFSTFFNRQEDLNNVWLFDSNKVTLSTDDEVLDLKRGCVVKFNDKLWLVESTQRRMHKKESEFSKKISYQTIIALTRKD